MKTMAPKIKEHTCTACNGTGFPVVKQPALATRKINPVKCLSSVGTRRRRTCLQGLGSRREDNVRPTQLAAQVLCRLLALFGPDAPGRRCPLIGEEPKFAARCQSDAIDPNRKSAPGKCAPDRVQFWSCKGYGYQAFNQQRSVQIISGTFGLKCVNELVHESPVVADERVQTHCITTSPGAYAEIDNSRLVPAAACRSNRNLPDIVAP
jgi:hypothetical protein